jgi:hypothetical protein
MELRGRHFLATYTPGGTPFSVEQEVEWALDPFWRFRRREKYFSGAQIRKTGPLNGNLLPMPTALSCVSLEN